MTPGLIERLEAGPVHLTHKEAYDLAVYFGSDVALSLSQTIRKAFAGKSLDAALALASRVLDSKSALHLLADLLSYEAAQSDFDLIKTDDLPRLLCIAILKARATQEQG